MNDPTLPIEIIRQRRALALEEAKALIVELIQSGIFSTPPEDPEVPEPIEIEEEQ